MKNGFEFSSFYEIQIHGTELNKFFDDQPFIKNRSFWYKIFKNIVATFNTLLLTPAPLESKLVDYSLRNWSLKILQKSFFDP